MSNGAPSYVFSLIEPPRALDRLPYGLTASDEQQPWLWLPVNQASNDSLRILQCEALNDLQPDCVDGFYRLFAPPRVFPARRWDGTALAGPVIALAVVLQDALLPDLPAIKSAAAYDGQRLVLLSSGQLLDFTRQHRDRVWVGHRMGLIFETLAAHHRRQVNDHGSLVTMLLQQQFHDVRLLDLLCRQPLPAGHLGLLRPLPVLVREALLRADPAADVVRALGALTQWQPGEARAAPWGFVAANAVACFHIFSVLSKELARQGLPSGLQPYLAEGVDWPAVLGSAFIGAYRMSWQGVPVDREGWQDYRRRLGDYIQNTLDTLLGSNDQHGLLRCVEAGRTRELYFDDLQVRRRQAWQEEHAGRVLFQRGEHGWLSTDLFKPLPELQEPLCTLYNLAPQLLIAQNLHAYGGRLCAQAAWGGAFQPGELLLTRLHKVLAMPATGKLLLLQLHRADAPALLLQELARFWAGCLVIAGLACYGSVREYVVLPVPGDLSPDECQTWLARSFRLVGRLLKTPEQLGYHQHILASWAEAAAALSAGAGNPVDQGGT
jgi:hypothetical protein